MEKKTVKKLTLNKETVRSLEDEHLGKIGGALAPTEGWIRTGDPCHVQICVY